MDTFLETIGLVKYAKNFKDRGVEKIEDLRDETHENLQNYFVITNYRDRKTLMAKIGIYFEEYKKMEKMEFYTEKHGKDLEFISGNIVKHNGSDYDWRTCIFGKEINNKMCKQFSISVKARKGNPYFMFGYITSTIENSVKN